MKSPPPITPRIFEDEDALGLALAQRIVDGVRRAGHQGRKYLLGCPGGRSPLSTYRALPAVAAQQSVDLSPLVVVMMDDYVILSSNGYVHVPINAHYSCRRFATEEIGKPLAHLPGAPNRDRIWMPDPSDPPAYDRRIADAGGIDLFLLASGASDGHIGFNPSGSPRDSATRIVELSTPTRTDNLRTFPDFDSLDEVPNHGVTVGISTIAELSRTAVMVCLGAEKRRAAERIASARSYDPSWPATIATEIPDAQLWIDLCADSEEQPARDGE
ncbi:MAG: 6-phosphogluconolactonase [bacterium]|nr:6-phosphogluconolactonase [bacterium]